MWSVKRSLPLLIARAARGRRCLHAEFRARPWPRRRPVAHLPLAQGVLRDVRRGLQLARSGPATTAPRVLQGHPLVTLTPGRPARRHEPSITTGIPHSGAGGSPPASRWGARSTRPTASGRSGFGWIAPWASACAWGCGRRRGGRRRSTSPRSLPSTALGGRRPRPCTTARTTVRFAARSRATSASGMWSACEWTPHRLVYLLTASAGARSPEKRPQPADAPVHPDPRRFQRQERRHAAASCPPPRRPAPRLGARVPAQPLARKCRAQRKIPLGCFQ